jgi:RHS repeat-associated protein
VSQSYGDKEILFSYDQNSNGLGRLSSISDENGSSSFAYDSLGRLTGETRVIGSSSATIGYGYDATTGEIQSITYPSGRVVIYNRDTDGQVTSITIDGQTIVSAVSHLPFGPLKSATLGAVDLTRGYDQRYDLAKIQAGSLNYIYSRDAEGHVTAIENLPAPTVTNLTVDYSYGPDNNRLSQKNTTSYSYDAVGNLLSDGIRSFIYDGLNRLIRVEVNSQTIASYGYDASNRRIIKITGSTTVHYLYDSGDNLIAETLADGTPLRDYIYLDGEVIAVKEYQNNPGHYYYLNDHLGTPQQLVTAAGEIVWHAAYLPFGKAQITVEQVVNNLRFPGQYFDAETGLHYNWNRYYCPEIGRYITADPIGLAGGINLYAYTGGDPINLTDPEGLDWLMDKVSGPDWNSDEKKAKRDKIIAARKKYEQCMPHYKPVTEERECCITKCLKKAAYGPFGELSTQAMGAIGSTATKIAQRKGLKTAIVSAGSKFLPGIGWVSTALSVDTFNSCMMDCGILVFPCGNPDDFEWHTNPMTGKKSVIISFPK